ncbi:MAG TPA: hypothetical protein VGG02_14750 [Chthoniobacterales bacterium]|jgi:anti-sigma factor RsiW
MKTFEEKWTAWVDDQMNDEERIAFEASLDDPRAAAAEKNEARQLRALLQEQLSPRAMANAEFFHHQLGERIARETPAPREHAGAGLRETWWSIRRLVWLGATSLAAFAICAFFVLRQKPETEQSQYLTQILNAQVAPAVNPDATVSIFQTKQDKVTVLWVDGLKSLPSEYAAK